MTVLDLYKVTPDFLTIRLIELGTRKVLYKGYFGSCPEKYLDLNISALFSQATNDFKIYVSEEVDEPNEDRPCI